MQEIGNSLNNLNARLVLRISRRSISFSVVDNTTETQLVFEPYIIKSGISLAANLRGAFAESDLLLRGYQRAQAMIDASVLMIPISEFDENTAETLYRRTFVDTADCTVLHTVLPGLNAVAVFAVNKDLKLVLTDHFCDIRFCPIAQPVWSYLHKRSFVGA